jgi:hypothetical protein
MRVCRRPIWILELFELGDHFLDLEVLQISEWDQSAHEENSDQAMFL